MYGGQNSSLGSIAQGNLYGDAVCNGISAVYVLLGMYHFGRAIIPATLAR